MSIINFQNNWMSYNRCLMVFLFLFVTTGTNLAKVSAANAESHINPGWHESTLTQPELNRYYRYFIPSNYHKNLPLVILLHGGTRSMNKLFAKRAGASKQWPILAEKENFILLVPNGTNPKTNEGSGEKQNWNDCRIAKKDTRYAGTADDVDFISRLVDWSKQHLNHHANQVYVTGASNGGMMSFRIAMELPNKIDAVATFIANLPADSECHPKNQAVPMMIFNGTEDPLIPWQGGEIKWKGGRVKSTKETVEYWLNNNNSDRDNKISYAFPDVTDKDKSNISGVCYPAKKNSKDSATTCFYQVNGGGHVPPSIKHRTSHWLQKRILGWQNRDLESAELAWSFFTNSNPMTDREKN